MTKPVITKDHDYHNQMLTAPQLVAGLKNVFITEVTIHPDGEYVMAITSNGKLYIWGCGPQDNNMYVLIAVSLNEYY